MRKSIRAKLVGVTLLLLCIPSLIIGIVGYVDSKESMNELGKTTLKNGVEMAIQTMNALQEGVESGDLSESAAKEKMKELLIGEKQKDGARAIESPVDLGENGYFMVYSPEGDEIAHPSLEGENVWDAEDEDGNLLVQEQIDVAQNGGGFTTYSWEFPNSDKVGDKITYNQLEPDWGWVVAASTYEKDFNEASDQLLYILLVTLGISLLIGGVIIVLLSAHLAKPLKQLTSQVEEVAKGNLAGETIVFNRKDEIGQLGNGINQMVDNLRSLIGAVHQSAATINATSQNLSAVSEETNASGEEISKAVSEISGGAGQQASDLESTLHMTNQLMEQIQTVYNQSAFILESSNGAQEANGKGVKSVEVLQEKSKQTNELISGVQVVMGDLTNHVKEIESVLGSISAISEQTNLLALNASIEAARAGEHGKGFAVVAEEVRKLAEQSSEATQEVRATISMIVQQTQQANESMDQATQVVEDQNMAVTNTNDAFYYIQESVESITKSIHGVSKDMDELIQSKDTLYNAVESVTAITEETAASTEQVNSSVDEQQKAIGMVASSATELSEATQALQEEVDQFHL
ncbi:MULTISPECIES: methyl-accepting chemotaxis protein [Pontibacillus]|uniref:Methyl-accepting chemotaxis protein n=1 Tax=Pontibacillus chungwhensis TaxID=265426 RepID=A0ABY8V014_9BACI|nr:MULTISPECIES: methyl-accepting chemotaxis protein [Pontibacillus]MCD5324882.1 methyl-accepting chemotaxis protein [Pontibacillus sp. HN14]WIF98843.1 methyl-accepting chemotaxis protein [Pontibacillus chungwhensis]